MPGEHATLSPSSAERWISCPASVGLSARYSREEGDSIFAREGTAAHGLAEIYGRHAYGYLTADERDEAVGRWEEEFADVFKAPTNSDREEMFETAEEYVRVIQNLASRYKHSQVFFEERLPTGVPQSWGTSDAVIVSPLAVHIVDLKYGKGIEVSATDNAQLRLYALGALDQYGDLLGETELVAMTVFQPRIFNTDTAEMSPEELRAWRADTVIPAAELALKGEGAPFGPSESACRWCPVAGACKARAEFIAESDFGTDPDVLDDDEIAEILPRLGDIQRWTEDVKKEALQRAYTDGREIPGHKVILRGGKRIVRDQTLAIQRLIDAGWTAEQVADMRLVGVTALDKLLGEKVERSEVLGSLVSRTEGKPAVVPESDPGVAVTAESRAAEDFSELDDTSK